MAVATSKIYDIAFRYGRPVMGAFLAGAGLAFGLLRAHRTAAGLLMRASRLTDARSYSTLLRTQIGALGKGIWSMLGEPIAIEELDKRCVVLKEPEMNGGVVIRRGILVVTFTETCGMLLASCDSDALANLFRVVLEPSWAGYADPALLGWEHFPHPVLVQASEPLDREFLRSTTKNLVPVSYGAGDWVKPAETPAAGLPERDIDLISVANYGPWKRVHAFLEAVSAVRRVIPDYRAVLVLAGHQRSLARESQLAALIDHLELRESLEVLHSLPRTELIGRMWRSKVLLFTSWKEGSSRVLYEAMSAGVHLVVSSANVGVNKDYIRDAGGSVVDDSQLVDELLRLYRNGTGSHSRSWFLRNIGPWNTTLKLQMDLDRTFPEDGWMNVKLPAKGNVIEATVEGEVTNRPLSYWLAAPSLTTG